MCLIESCVLNQSKKQGKKEVWVEGWAKCWIEGAKKAFLKTCGYQGALIK